MKKVYIESNGCSVVRHDTQRYSKYFRVNGWEEVKTAKEADLVLLTTCAVVQNTEDFSIKAVNRLKKEIRKDSELIVGGCLPRINSKRLSSEFNGFTFSKDEEDKLDKLIDAKIKIADIFWNGDIFREHSLGDPELVYTKEQLNQLKLVENLSKKFKDNNFLEIYNYLTKGRFMWKEDGLFEVKVADGCNYRCSYCATKNAKGNLKSRNPKKIIAEFKFGVEKGYSKIMLTGDEVGEFGIDIGTSLVKLLEKLVPISGDSKIALRYISPESLIRQYKDLEKYFKSGKIYYYCASFQSGSSRILKLMNRPNNISQLTKITSQMSRDCKNVYKHTQIIIGFPQETENDFVQTLKAIKDADFEYVSIIKYSKRPGTKAAKMRGHISEAVTNDRYKRACELVFGLRKEKLKTLIYEELLKNILK
ncbi:MAG: radical SAM protein [Patescibacteria group bacterium]|nr:radical SAM protein [Patescibacteria group bacterium]